MIQISSPLNFTEGCRLDVLPRSYVDAKITLNVTLETTCKAKGLHERREQGM